MSRIDLPKNVELILQSLNEKGFDAFIVGGFLRDYLLGKQTTDIDIATSATPLQVSEVFSKFSVIDIGIKHGTVTVLIEKIPYEITTFRADGDYLDSRKPESVEFINDIKSDLLRRDFTINALAYSHVSGILDFYGGISDISNKTIKCVGEPETRFKEDALRILRAIRFAATLDFGIESNTLKAMKQQAFRIKNISSERITQELIKILMSDNPVKGIKLIFQICLKEVFPEAIINNKINSLNNSKKSLILRLSIMLLNAVKLNSFTVAIDFFNRLKFDNYTKSKVLKILEIINIEILPNEIAIKYLLKQYGQEIIKELIEVKRNITETQSHDDLDKALELINIIEQRKDCYSLKNLVINGNDLLEIGFKEDKSIGDVLEILLNLVINGEILNKREFLKTKAKDILITHKQKV